MRVTEASERIRWVTRHHSRPGLSPVEGGTVGGGPLEPRGLLKGNDAIQGRAGPRQIAAAPSSCRLKWKLAVVRSMMVIVGSKADFAWAKSAVTTSGMVG